MPITIKPTQLKYKDPSTSQYVSVVAAAEGGSSNIDVQLDGTSILNNGIANIPLASSSTLGVVKAGDGLYVSNSSKRLNLAVADTIKIKAGTDSTSVITPSRQHDEVFYGLAKAAGEDMSSSSNEVGVYTDAAKTAIQSMLAVSSSNNPIFTGAFSQNRKSNTTVGTNSFSSGDNCEASAEDSHAEGRYTVASGYYSHAEGNYTTASGMASHAAGTVTIANHASQYTFGEYNVEDSSSASALARGNYIEIVGNGTASNAKSNARALDWNGNEYLNGYIYVGCGNDSTNGTRIPHDIQINGTSIVNNGIASIPIADGTTLGVIKVDQSSYGLRIQDGELRIVPATDTQIKSATNNTRPITSAWQHYSVFYGLATAAGDSTQSASSNAVGVYTNNAKSAIQNMLGVLSINDPIFTGSLSCGRTANSYSGTGSIAIGTNIIASGYGSIGFGYESEATGSSSIAGGHSSEAIGAGAIAVGTYNVAIYSNEVVLGRYNFVPTHDDWIDGTEYEPGDIVKYENNIYKCYETTDSAIPGYSSNWRPYTRNLLTVGNGGYIDDRSNALTLTVDGDLYLHKDLYINADISGNNGSKVATEAYVSTSIGNIILPTKVSDLTNDSGFLTSVPTMTGATASTNGTSGLVPAPTSGDIYKFLAGDGTYRSGGLPMVILSYGNSTWNDFIEAYNNNVIVYCRASSNSNPASGSQTRMAFMAYVNDAASPTNVEFQYYRSMSSHSATAMGDEVYVYKLTNANGGTWSVTTRPASIKEIKAGTNEKIGVSWSDNKVTLSNTMTADDMPMSSSDATTAKGAIDTINTKLGSIAMGTTATTITGAIAEHESDIGALNSNIIDHGRIELSSLSKSTVVGSTTYYFDDFSFNKTFPSAPHLIMSTVNNAWPGAGDIGGNYFATNVTATGFRLISVYKIASYYMDWIAIGSNA